MTSLLLLIMSDLSAQQLQQLNGDTIFDTPQGISILSISKKDTSFNFSLAHHPTDLVRTSQFAKENKAIAAINGGFFDMQQGGSITYLEAADSVFHTSRNLKNKVINNGAIVIDQQGHLSINFAKPPQYYANSTAEKAVLFTGPILLYNGTTTKLRPSSLVSQRHPRTCICETQETIQFITIDGRRQQAIGMNLLELQQYLLTQNCVTAINLDGGGSTTMWLREEGVVNNPSDLFGERPVANAILLIEKD